MSGIINNSKSVDHSQYILGPDPAGGPHSVMPLGRVHLVSGGSGSGKTTLLMQMWKAAQEGKSFLGYPTQWHPSVYVAFDRRPDETRETMERIGLNPNSIPFCYYEVALPSADWGAIDDRLNTTIRDVLNHFPGTKVIYLDGLFILAPHGRINDYMLMSQWLQRAGMLCEQMDITLVGVVHASKQRKGNELLDPRSMSTGSVANGGFTSCQIVVTREFGDDKEGRRTVWVYPRNAAEKKEEMILDDKGRLIPDANAKDDRHLIIEHYMKVVSQGVPRRTEEIVDYVMAGGKVSAISVKRYIKEMLEIGKLVKVKHGVYALASLVAQAESSLTAFTTEGPANA